MRGCRQLAPHSWNPNAKRKVPGFPLVDTDARRIRIESDDFRFRISPGRAIPTVLFDGAFCECGVPPYTWSVTTADSTLPEGMTINSATGVISSAAVGGQGGYQFQVQVKDAAGAIATALETINVNADNITWRVRGISPGQHLPPPRRFTSGRYFSRRADSGRVPIVHRTAIFWVGQFAGAKRDSVYSCAI